MSRTIVLAAILALAPAAIAQQSAHPAPNCSAIDADLGEFAAWKDKAATPSAGKAADLAKATLTVGKAYTADLLPTPDVAYAVQPEKPGGSVSKGGMFAFKVEQAGTYGVALGTAAWVDVVKGGAVQKSTTFGHGPDCTSVRKVVNFALEPGDYTVQIAGNADPKLNIMVLRRP